jgi:hypothetical protein
VVSGIETQDVELMEVREDRMKVTEDMGRICAEIFFLAHGENGEPPEEGLSASDKTDLHFAAMLMQHARGILERVGAHGSKNDESRECPSVFFGAVRPLVPIIQDLG